MAGKRLAGEIIREMGGKQGHGFCRAYRKKGDEGGGEGWVEKWMAMHRKQYKRSKGVGK